jgi:hypothetical protein
MARRGASRKAPAVTRPRSCVERRTRRRLPYFAPEIPLLYKALATVRRPADDSDLAAVLPALAPEPPRVAGPASWRARAAPPLAPVLERVRGS